MFKVFKAGSEESLEGLLFSQIKNDLKSGEKVILVVPAQASLAVEKKAFDILDEPGFFNLRIMRGQKLHEDILHECGYPGLQPVNTIGRSMLLRRISAEHKNELKTFGGVVSENGFINMAGDFIVQLKQNNLSEEEFNNLIKLSGKNSLLSGKLEDMKLIYDEYTKALAGKFTDSEDLLEFVSGKVRECEFIKQYKIYFHGFYSFTKREINFLKELEARCVCLGVSLLFGRGNAFAVTGKTFGKLSSSFENTESISAPEENAPLLDGVSSDMHVVKCANPYSMAETIAADIRRLVREKSYAYSDIAVLTGNDPQLISSLKKVFSSLNIPLFADEKRSVLHNSAIEAVLSLLDMVCSDFSADAVIRFCKSGIMDFVSEDIEDFAHYVKRYHIKGEKFFTPFKYGTEEFGDGFGKIESMRSSLASVLERFTASIKKTETAAELAECFYEYLENELGLSSRLDSLALRQAEEGFVDAAEETSQVFDAVCEILDQISELLGKEKLSVEEFAEIFKNACTDVKLGVLPQAAGKVSLGLITRSFIEGAKALYVAGFNDGVVPSSGDADGILTEDELCGIEKYGISLAKTSDTLYEEDLYWICKNLGSVKEYLWMGWYGSDAKGADAKPSALLNDILSNYPDVKTVQDISDHEGELSYLEGKDLAASRLARVLRDSLSSGEVPPLWQEVYNNLKDEKPEIAEGIKYTNSHKPIGPAMAKTLFAGGKDYSLSPSRMDNFASCPFKHFVHYGLRPDEPRDFTVGGSEVGIVYHEALMRLCGEIKDWRSVSDSEIEEKLNVILDDIYANRLDGLMLSGKAESYTNKRVRTVCLRFAKHMAEQLREENIETMFLETRFGKGQTFPPIELSTAAGKLYVEGQIDRVDICKGEDGKYIRVVDYKSGSIKFSKELVEAGLQLQLMVYLKAAAGDITDSFKGGVYYFSIKDPKASATLEELPLKEISEEVLSKIRKEYKLDGMDVDSEFTARFENTLTDLCEKLAMGFIDAEPKTSVNNYDSCAFCAYSSICFKDITG